MRDALMGTTAIVGVALAAPAAGQATLATPSQGGTITGPSAAGSTVNDQTPAGGGINLNLADAARATQINAVTVTDNSGAPSADALHFTSAAGNTVSLRFNGVNNLTTNVSGGAAVNLASSANSYDYFMASGSTLTGSYGFYGSATGQIDLNTQGFNESFVANGSAVAGVYLRAPSPTAELAASTISGFATGVDIGGSIVSVTTTGGSITGTTYGIRTAGAAILTLGGAVSGGTNSILLDSSDDAVTLNSGATLSGVADFGGGTNSLTLAGAGTTDTLNASNVLNATSLVKTGTGTWTLTGTQGSGDFTGGVAINGGTLVVSNAAALSNSSANLSIVNQGSLVFAQTEASNNNSYSYNEFGTISGAGSVTVQSNSLFLYTAASYTGATLVEKGGNLELVAPDAIASSSGLTIGSTASNLPSDVSIRANQHIASLASGGTGPSAVIFNGNYTLTLTNASGTFNGTLVQTGGVGSLVIAGGNQTLGGGASPYGASAPLYSGGTTINSGATLTATTNTAIGTGAVVDNGTLAFVGASGTVANSITGSGGITVSGTGPNTLTFSGSLAQSNASTTPIIPLSVLDSSNVTTSGSFVPSAADTNALVYLSAAGTFTNLGTMMIGQGAQGIYSNGNTSSGGIINNGSSTVTTASLSGGDRGILYAGGSAPLVVNNWGSIQGGQYNGIQYANTGLLTVTNNGTGAVIYGQGTAGSGYAGVADTSTALLTVSNAGKIVGTTYGVIANGAASITNTGTIAAGTLSGNTVTPGSKYAIQIGSGTVNNLGGTLRSGGAGVYQTSSAGTLSLVNTGTIAESNYVSGVSDPADTVVASGAAKIFNSGMITTPLFYAVGLAKGGSVTNAAGGLISAGTQDSNRYGVHITGASGTVNNYGTIKSTSTDLNRGIQTDDNAATINLYAGSTTGSIVTGAGADNLTLYNGTGTAFTGATYDSATDAVTAGITTGPTKYTVQTAGINAAAAFATGATVNLGGGTNTLTLAGAGTYTGTGMNTTGAAGALNISTIGGLTNLVKQNTGTWTLTGAAAYTGTTTISGGTLVDAGVGFNQGGTASALSSLGNGATSIASGATLQFDNESGALRYVKGGQFSGAGTIAFTANAAATPTAIGYGGNGAVYIALAPTGQININSGTVNGSSSNEGIWTNAVGTVVNQAGLYIAPTATFDGVEGTIYVDALTGSGILQGGYGDARTTTVGTGNGSGTFAGVIRNSPVNGGSVLALTKTGTGIQTLTNTNTYTGATTISGGTLALSGTGSIASSGIEDDATLDISGLTNGGTTVTALTGSGSVNLGGNKLTIGTAGVIATSISDGGIAGGTGGQVELSGAGTYIFSGANTYTGATTIDNGVTLQGTAATLSPYSAIVDNGALAFVQGGAGGIFSPGVSGTGVVTVSGTGANTLTFAGALTDANGVIVSDGSTVAIASTGSIAPSTGTVASAIYGTGANFTVNNAGTISAPGNQGAAFGSNGIYATAGVVVNNTGKIYGIPQGSTATYRGDGVITFGDSVVNNTGATFTPGTNYTNGTLGSTTAGGGVITGGWDGVYVTGNGTVFNSGAIAGNVYQGVNIQGNGSITNYAGGKIVGVSDGAEIDASGPITNSGQIVAGLYNSSTGAIAVGTTGIGVRIATGTVTNNAGGQIVGGSSNTGNNDYGVIASGATTITNNGPTMVGGVTTVAAGKIVGGYTGVELDAGGTVNNYGLIGSGTFAVGDTGTTLTSGFTQGGQDGIRLFRAGGTVNNYAGSAIEAGASGIYLEGSATTTIAQVASITNAGLITATNGVYAAGGTMGKVALTVNNQTGGVITATNGNAVYNSNNDIALTNAGTIQQTGANGGQAVNLTGTLTLTNTGTISNTATNANYGIYVSGNLAAGGSNSGTITAGAASTALYVTGTTPLTNSGTIVGGTRGIYSGGAATLNNSGLIGAGALSGGATGTFTANGNTAIAIAGGTVENTSGATIGGALTSSAALTLNNAGAMNAVTVTGAGANTISLRSGSTTGAVTLGGGDDGVTLFTGTGSSFAGIANPLGGTALVSAGVHNAATVTSLNLGSGTNTITLNGAGTEAAAGSTVTGQQGSLGLNTVTGLSTLVKSSSGNWVLSGAATGTTAAATIYAGNTATTGASGVLQFSGTTGLTGAIYQNGATVQVDGANALGAGVVHIVSAATGQADLAFVSTSAIGNAIALETSGAAAVLQSNAGVTGTIGGVIANGTGTMGANIDGQTIVAAPVTVQGGGTIVFGGANTYTGLTTVTGTGTVLSLANGNAIADANAVQVGDGGRLSLATGFNETIGTLNDKAGQATTGSVALGANTLTLAGNGASSFSGVISGSGGILKQGSGTLTLSGMNSFTGTLEVATGTLSYGANNVLADTATVTVDAPATFDLHGYSDTIGTLNLYGTLSNGGSLTATTYNAYAGSTINQAIGGSGTLNVYGNTALNSQTNAAPVNIYAGTLTTGSAELLSDTGAVNIASGGTLALGGNETIGGLGDLAYGMTTNGGTVALGANTLTVGGAAASGAGSFSGVLTSTTGGGFTKAGGGTLILSGANAYNGVTTIAGGTLQGTTASISGSSIVDNATLAYVQAGSGTVGQNISGSGVVTVSGLAAGNVLTVAGTNTQGGGFVVTDASGVTFTGANTGAATEVTLQGASTLTNAGSITGATGVAGTVAGVSILNTGSITGNGGTAIVLAGGTVANAGNAAIGGALTSSGGLTFYNGGSVGAVSDTGNVADVIRLYAGSTTGTVTTGSGDDTLTLHNGSGANGAAVADPANAAVTLVSAGAHAAAVFGAIDLGGGANALRLRGAGDGTAANGAAGSADLSTVANVATITKLDAGSWTLTGAATASVANATINAGTGTGLGGQGLLNLTGSGLTGTIYVNGAVTQANGAGTLGTGVVHLVDPTLVFATASTTYANNFVLDVARPGQGSPSDTSNDPSTFQANAGVVATLTGTITTGMGNNVNGYAIDPTQPVVIAGAGTVVLTNAGNAWTGVTTVNTDATLQGTTASISGGSIVDNGVVNFSQAAAGTSARAISGGGVVQVNGGGNVSLTGALTTTGGVQIGTGGIATLSNASGTGNTVVTLTGANATLNVAQGGRVAATNGGAVFGVAQNGTLNNAGTVSSSGNFSAIYFNPNLGTATVANTGTVTAFGSAVFSGAGTTLALTNSGTLTSANRPAVFANGNANVTNAAAGTINGFFGVYANGALTLANAGQITAAGTGGNAVTANSGGSIVSTGTLTATTAGGWGVQMSGTGSVDNQGTINADSGLVATTGTGVSFTNEGTITGITTGVLGYNGVGVALANTGTITGGQYGVQATGPGSSITNGGTIAGSASGAVGVAIAGGTLTNQSGGIISAGQTNGMYGTAIQLTGTGNVLNLQAGSTVNGRIDASGTTDGSNSYTFTGMLNGGFTGGSGNDTVTLVTPVTVTGPLDGGAGTDTLVLDGTAAGTLGSAQVVNFENGVKQGSGTWTLTGTTAASPSAFAINAGTLAVAGGNALADTAAITIAGGATLQLNAAETIGSLAGAGNVALGANTLTTGGLNASPTFSGVIAGSGGLTKVGTGTLTLAGANSYTGATSVNAGTLALGVGNAIAAGSALSVATGATLNLATFNDTVATAALNGTLAGTGTLTAASYTLNGAAVNANLGTGTLTQVSSASTLAGTTATTTVNVAGGTLSLGASDRIVDTALVTVTPGATLNLGGFSDTVGALALGGTLAGTGTLTAGTYTLGAATVIANLGTGTLNQASGTSVLAGTSNAGATNVNAGTLRLGASDRIVDSSVVTIANGATFDLAGYNETIGTLAGAGAVMLGAGTLTTGGNNIDTVFSGRVSGTGSLAKVGTGTLTLTGANTLTGAIAANAGTLALLGSTAGSVRVQGGTLTGTGQVAGTLTLSSGTLSVGTPTAAVGMMSAGSLTVTGGSSVFDFAGATGGFTSDRINVAGAATLSGGLVSARATEPTANYRVMQTYTLIQAGSVAGTFANGNAFTAVSNASDLFYRLRYDLVPGSVLLEVRKQIDFTAGLAGAGASGNQFAVGAALNGSALGASDAFANVLNQIQLLSAADRATTYNSISGEGIADISTSVGLMNQRFTELLRRRLSSAGGSSANGGNLVAALVGGTRGLASARASGVLDGASQAFADGTGGEGTRGGAWVQSFGGYGLLRGQPGSANLYDQSYGIAGGVDTRVGPVTLGIAGSGAGVDTRVAARASKGNGTIYQGAGYAAYDDGRLFANVLGTYFSGDVRSTRSVFVGAAQQGVASGKARAHGYGGSIAAGYRIELGGGTTYTPQVSFEATRVTRNAFTETGIGVLNLAVARQKRTLYQADAEGRLSHRFDLGGGTGNGGGTVEPYIGGGINANWGDRQALDTMQITGAPAGTGSFVIDGAHLARYTGLITGGIDGHPSDRVTLGVGLQAHRSPRQKDGAVQIHAKIAF